MSNNSGTPGQGGVLDYDKLPEKIRKALRDFPLEMDAGFALQMLKRGKSERELLQMLERRKQSLSEFNPENVKRGIR